MEFSESFYLSQWQQDWIIYAGMFTVHSIYTLSDIRTICRQQRMHNGQQQLHLQASFGIGAGKLTQQLASPLSLVGTHDCNPFTEHYTYHLSKANTLLGSLIELWEINLMCSIYMVFSFVNYDTLEWINYVWMCWLWQLCYELWSLYANLKASICKFYCRKN